MTLQQHHSTGPKTLEGKARCRLKRRFHSSTNAYRHGLTGQVNILTPDEQQAYEKHSGIILEALAPVGDFERDIVQTSFPLFDRSVADDRWRLKRARAIESGMFALGIQSGVDDTGSGQVDDALAQARTWSQEARNLNLLTIYAQTSFPLFDQRIQRSLDKNMAQLQTLQAERKEAAREAMRQAKLLYQLALAEGKPCQPETYFTAPPVLESVFSTSEIARELSRVKLLADAETWHTLGKLPEPGQVSRPTAQLAAEASAGNSRSYSPDSHSPAGT